MFPNDEYIEEIYWLRGNQVSGSIHRMQLPACYSLLRQRTARPSFTDIPQVKHSGMPFETHRNNVEERIRGEAREF